MTLVEIDIINTSLLRCGNPAVTVKHAYPVGIKIELTLEYLNFIKKTSCLSNQMISDITTEIFGKSGGYHPMNVFWVEIELLPLDSMVFMLPVM